MGGKGNISSSHAVADAAESSDESVDSDEEKDLFDPAAVKTINTDNDSDEDMEFSSVQCLFSDRVFPNAQAFWAHAATEHGFSIDTLRSKIGREVWTDYHRIRLVNFLRSLGPQKALQEAPKLTAENALWSDDSWLQPVMEDDPLLFEEDGMDPEDGGCHEAERHDTAEVSSMSPVELQAEVMRLRKELEGARKLLSEVVGTDDAEPFEQGRIREKASPKVVAFDAAQSRCFASDPRRGEAFRQFAVARPDILEGRSVLDADCSGGVLSCLCAKLGAQAVCAIAPSTAVEKVARDVISANSLSERVRVHQGSANDENLELSLKPSSSSGKSGGHGQCDVVVSERLLGELRFSSSLPALLATRHLRLRPGGRVLPAHAELHVSAVDFSDCDSDGSSPHGVWWQTRGLMDLDLSCLAPSTAPTISVASATECESRNASAPPNASLLDLDLETAVASDAAPSEVPFRLALRQDRCATALALHFGARLDHQDKAPIPSQQHTILHLPASSSHPTMSGMRLPGTEFNMLEGRFSVTWHPGATHLQLDVKVVAHHTAGGENLCTAGTFMLI
mmetsp:Transcript_126053/g.251661  ORF Transcript_126053/g.251661 Transcript_126053/m.251661 type:complete len:565 (+) Transcript_126053:72-1766(+)|eukprot:CAMPEP_0172803480 /NCGR_PEP_ID=MMETSP1075-20121228/4532_1 /TAXON_ID=2916 /ORGANISM="Ceratium fusus, Strain PA161109" /LENGTH=564 /DNA_ID=CAMNT_0013641913 /DNA_START=61 /DNA_END=1755 /DNA_ORIENTATION=+